MHYKLGNGLVVLSPKPIRPRILADNHIVVRRITWGTTAEDIELIVVKCRDGRFVYSDFWIKFREEFPSAYIETLNSGDVIKIPDAGDCVRLTLSCT